jgi:hypothetical protein
MMRRKRKVKNADRIAIALWNKNRPWYDKNECWYHAAEILVEKEITVGFIRVVNQVAKEIIQVTGLDDYFRSFLLSKDHLAVKLVIPPRTKKERKKAQRKEKRLKKKEQRRKKNN